ncbi:MAG TPA: cytochrome b N-terminal domain-containing protein [Pyrinomonadaceae bacterium]|jgi:ubiquinol-cytochrome c reductase cytochrome b subunit
MMAEVERYRYPWLHRWLARWTTLTDIERSVIDEPESGFKAWARTTAGVVAMLLALQIVTGILLGFYYIPSTESAHTTVAYIEKVVPAGSWLRSLHHYGSQWLTLALVLHLAQMFWRASYRRRPVGWMGTVVLLLLVLGAGATGYSLPWDARAFFGTRVTEGIAGGLPLVGNTSRHWLIGGAEITPLTLARFFAVHVLVLPLLIFLTIMLRLFVFRERGMVSDAEEQQLERWMHVQIARNAAVAGLVFLALALYAANTHAPLGPAADTAAPGYLPRPGAQFLWLFQMLKYLPGRAASVVAVALPSLICIGLLMLPFLNPPPLRKVMAHPRRTAGVVLFALGFALVTGMTIMAYVKDLTDPLTRVQLARQSAEEAAFRQAPFTPLRSRTSESVIDEERDGTQTAANGGGGVAPTPSPVASPATDTSGSASQAKTSATEPPAAYITHCSGCHGTRGQGASIYPRLIGVSSKPRRTVEDMIAIMNDPASYDLDPLMPSFAAKLSEDEKRLIAEWTAALKKRK